MSMRSIVYNSFGGFDKLKFVTESIPTEINPNYVLVKVKSTSLNGVDWKIMEGTNSLFRTIGGSKFPKHVGCDFSGVIEKVGSKVVEFKVGDEIFGAMDPFKSSGLSEYVHVADTTIVKKPSIISFQQAAGLPVAGAAAIEAINKSILKGGEEVLVSGCTGGVGVILIQLLKKKGAIVTGICSTKNLQRARELGCDFVIDYTKEDASKASKKYDIIYDLAAKWQYQDVASIMKPVASFYNFVPGFSDLFKSLYRNLFANHKVIIILSVMTKSVLEQLKEYAENGLIIEVGKAFSFDETVAAYEFAKKGGSIGKTVVDFEKVGQ